MNSGIRSGITFIGIAQLADPPIGGEDNDFLCCLGTCLGHSRHYMQGRAGYRHRIPRSRDRRGEGEGGEGCEIFNSVGVRSIVRQRPLQQGERGNRDPNFAQHLLHAIGLPDEETDDTETPYRSTYSATDSP
jgi:hypothetical protein